MSAIGLMEATKMATTMKAVVQEGSGSEAAVTLRDWAVPEVPDDRVLVKVRAASINAADYHTIHGGWLVEVVGKLIARGMKPYPVCGGDVAGVVAAVGKNVTTLRPGDEVFGNGRGTWAEYATAREGIVVTKPATLSFVEAAAVGVAATTALQGLRDKGGVKPGQRVLVYGAGGGVGTFAVQIAKTLGAHVTAVTGPRSIELVRPLGADVLVDYTKEDIRARRERFDVIFDVAAIKSLGYLRSMLVPGGILVLAGASKKGGWAGVFGRMIAGMLRARLLKQKVIFYVASLNGADTAYLRELLASGKIRPVIDRTYRLDEVREAVRYTMSGQGRAKVVLTVS